MQLVDTQWTMLEVDGRQMPVFLASPSSVGLYPAVVLWMEIFGINAHIQAVTKRIAAQGYVVLAPNFYHRVAPPRFALDYTEEDILIGRQYKNQCTHNQLLTDAQAVIRFLHNLPQVNRLAGVGSVGFCFGGYVAYVVAQLPQIKVTASFYGAGLCTGLPAENNAPIAFTAQIQSAMLCLFGGQDASIPAGDVERVSFALGASQVTHEVIVYPEADHGFFCDARASYHPQAAQAAWERLNLFFVKYLKTL